MKTAKVILLAVVGLLLLADIVGHILMWNAYNLYAGDKHFKILPFHTNDMSGTGIIEAKTGKPVWIEWNYTNGGKEFSYFLDGTNIFNLNLWEGKPPAYDVGFQGPGKSSVWWWDISRGTFIERNFFNTNGDFSKNEIWYDNSWHTVVMQNKKWGIIINEKWRQLTLPTNAMWTIETTTNR